MIVPNGKVPLRQLDPKTARKVLSADGSLMMVEVHFKKGGVGAVHSHDKHEQLSYIAEDRFEVTVGDEKMELQKGDCYYSPLNILDILTPIREDFLKG